MPRPTSKSSTITVLPDAAAACGLASLLNLPLAHIETAFADNKEGLCTTFNHFSKRAAETSTAISIALYSSISVGLLASLVSPWAAAVAGAVSLGAAGVYCKNLCERRLMARALARSAISP